MSQSCRLTATLAADVVGYSRLMGEHEEGRSKRLKTHRRHRSTRRSGSITAASSVRLRWLGKVRRMSAIGTFPKRCIQRVTAAYG